MSFLLNEEQRQFSDSAQEFLSAKSPLSLQRQLRDNSSALGFETSLWEEVIELGWTAAVFPESEGGLGFGYQGMGAVFEAIGRNVAALPLLSSIVLGGEVILQAGSAMQKQLWLPGLITGQHRLALAIDEQGRHDPSKIKTIATKSPDGWVLNGSKWFVMDGLGATCFVVVAKIETAHSDSSIGLFLVDNAWTGVKIQPTRLADSRNYAQLNLTNVRITEDMCLGSGQKAEKALNIALDKARACLAAEGLGLLKEAFDRTNMYLKERIQFDVPIGSFQALQHRMARLYTELQMLESCVRAALNAIDSETEDLALLASLAKARTSDLCEKLMNEAIQLHGGIGVTDEFDLGLIVKRARVLQQSLGDGVFHRNRYACLKGF
ncbi:MAG: acyl-CoA dehydrogenase [Burkholderiales bacterium]|nr:acyl-CoA dehydrogenase [Burkholderiales bacterium]